MLSVILCALSAMAAAAADDGWTKVMELKSGSELRITTKAAKQPLLVKMDEASPARIVVVVKNEQVAIPKDDIDRIDARPAQTGSRVRPESKTTTSTPGESTAAGDRIGPGGGGGGRPNTSYSSGVSIGSKPDFETVYRRTTAGPARKEVPSQ